MPTNRLTHSAALGMAVLATAVTMPVSAGDGVRQVPGAPPGTTVMLTATLSGYSDSRADANPTVSTVQFMDPAEVRGIELYATDAAYCSSGAFMAFGPRPNTVVSWGIEGRALSVDRDMITLDLRWVRRVDGTGLGWARPLEMRQRVTVRDGQSRPFDLVRTGESGSDACQWFVAGYGAKLLDPPQVSDARLRYDLWLVHRERGGTQVTRRLEKRGSQGEAIEYEFAPLFHTSEGLPLEEGAPGAMATTVFGEIKGRARLDGLIDITVDARRSIRVEDGATSSGGKKHLTLRPGETVEVQLPAPSGRHTLLTGRGTTVLEQTRVFDDQTTALRITATRLR